jgi:hypothetical protein
MTHHYVPQVEVNGNDLVWIRRSGSGPRISATPEYLFACACGQQRWASTAQAIADGLLISAVRPREPQG